MGCGDPPGRARGGILSPCSFQACGRILPGGARSHPFSCARGAALPKELLEPGSVVLFGEMHGAQEIPALFGEAVCAAASSGFTVEVGLLDHIRRLRASGLPLRAFVFDLEPGEDMSRRDEAMAGEIASHARAHPEALTMALTGEVHSWKTRGAPWNPEFLPMGWHMEQAGIRVRSLGRATPAGTVWICTGATPGDCGLKETKATGTLPSGRTAGIELLPEPSPRGYAGMYATSSLTASPPARIPSQPPAQPR